MLVYVFIVIELFLHFWYWQVCVCFLMIVLGLQVGASSSTSPPSGIAIRCVAHKYIDCQARGSPSNPPAANVTSQGTQHQQHQHQHQHPIKQQQHKQPRKSCHSYAVWGILKDFWMIAVWTLFFSKKKKNGTPDNLTYLGETIAFCVNLRVPFN